MFSGIVEESGVVKALVQKQDNLRLTIGCKLILEDIKLGASIAVNGICLTVVHFNDEEFTVEVVPETLKRTNIHGLKPGTEVNLERSLRFSERIGGHFVQGHIDTTVSISQITHDKDGFLVSFACPSQWSHYIVAKGYVALDGMSITVIAATASEFSVALIPHTLSITNAKHYQVGTVVNLEVDILGKYIERICSARGVYEV